MANKLKRVTSNGVTISTYECTDYTITYRCAEQYRKEARTLSFQANNNRLELKGREIKALREILSLE